MTAEGMAGAVLKGAAAGVIGTGARVAAATVGAGAITAGVINNVTGSVVQNYLDGRDPFSDLAYAAVIGGAGGRAGAIAFPQRGFPVRRYTFETGSYAGPNTRRVYGQEWVGDVYQGAGGVCGANPCAPRPSGSGGQPTNGGSSSPNPGTDPSGRK